MWRNVDALSPNAAIDPFTREKLRTRSRHVRFNNPYAAGVIKKLASDCIGPTPTLKMMTGVKAIDSQIERGFALWARRVGLAATLRQAVEAWVTDGEAFIRLGMNARSPYPRVPLNPYCIEADQVATPYLSAVYDPREPDGIEFDRWNNPTFYHVLREHPGENWRTVLTNRYEFDRVPAAEILHLFTQNRPGQRRGLPHLMSSLSLLEDRRGMRAAVLAAARVCAEMGAVLLKPNYGADDQDPPEEFEEIPLARGLMTTLPPNTEAMQLNPTQPATTFGEFDDRTGAEAVQPIAMPKNIAKGDSSEHNYSSARMDTQMWDRMLLIMRAEIERIVLDRVLRAWVDMALVHDDFLPLRARARLRFEIPCRWLWSNRGHVDPVKEQNARVSRITTGLTTREAELAEQGVDFDELLERIRLEREAMREAGLRVDEPLTAQQVAAAAKVLQMVTAGQMGQAAAVRLLVCGGIPVDDARAMVAESASIDPEGADDAGDAADSADKNDSDSKDDVSVPPAKFERRNGVHLPLVGSSNGNGSHE